MAYHNAEKLLDRNSLEWQKVQDRLEVLDPHLPKNMASGWLELARQLIGPVLVIFAAATLDAGLRPWWIDLSGWLAIFISSVGAFMWISAYSLPQNPLICLITGNADGLLDVSHKRLIAGAGIVIWLAALVLILLPIGQSPGQPP